MLSTAERIKWGVSHQADYQAGLLLGSMAFFVSKSDQTEIDAPTPPASPNMILPPSF